MAAAAARPLKAAAGRPAAAVAVPPLTPLPRALLSPHRQSFPVVSFATRSGGGSNSSGDSGPSKRRRSKHEDGNSSSSSKSRASAPPPPSSTLPPPPQQPRPPPPEVGWMWSGSGSGGRASATKQSLKSAGLRAKKSLGQNFLTDEGILARIAQASNIRPGDRVLEVGPGTGNLTRHLIALGARVTAVEKDDALAARLEESAPGLARIVHGDVLRVGLREVVAQMLAEDEGQQTHRAVKIVANLPYNITKEFLLAALPLGGELNGSSNDNNNDTHTSTNPGGVSEVTLMLEEDAARRLADPTPNRPDYRAMSVLVHRWSKPQYLFRIPRDRYYPPPGVDGAMVTFRLVPPHSRPPLPFPPGEEAERLHAALVNAAFSERRKMMRNVLTSGVGRGGRDWGAATRDAAVVAASLQDAGARDEARPQELSSAQFAKFHWALAQRCGGSGGGESEATADGGDGGA